MRIISDLTKNLFTIMFLLYIYEPYTYFSNNFFFFFFLLGAKNFLAPPSDLTNVQRPGPPVEGVLYSI